MKRKLVAQGNGALTITLPYKWLEKNALAKGDYLELHEAGREILLSTETGHQKRVREIRLFDNIPFFKRYLRSSYILGYDAITILSDRTLPFDDINLALGELIGFEIIEQSSKRILVSSVTGEDAEGDFDNIIKRVFFMISSMFGECLAALQQGKIENMKEIAKMESSVNRLTNYCFRILNKKGYGDYRKTPYIYSFISGLESISDSVHNFCCTLDSNNPKIQTYLSEITSYYDDIFKLFYKYDMKKIQAVKQKRNRIYQKTSQVVEEMPQAAIHLYYCLMQLHQLEIALDPINA